MDTFLATLAILFLFHCPSIHANVSRNITIPAVDRSILYTPSGNWIRKGHHMLAVANQSFAMFAFNGTALYYHDADILPLHGSAYKFSLDNGVEVVWTAHNRSGITSQGSKSDEKHLIYSSTGLINAQHIVKIVFEPPLHSPIRVGYFTYTHLEERTSFDGLEEILNGEFIQMKPSDQYIIDSYNWLLKRCHDLRLALEIVGGLFGLVMLYLISMCRRPARQRPTPEPKPKPKKDLPKKIPEEAMQSGRD